MSSMKDHQETNSKHFVGPRPRSGKTTLTTRWFELNTSCLNIFITWIVSRMKLNAYDLTLWLLWATLRVGVYLILLVLLAYVALLFLALRDLRSSPHSTQHLSFMRANGPTA